MPKKVMSLSADLGLLITRNNALATAGFIVKSPRDVAHAPSLLESEEFDAVLIGNSIAPPVRQFVIHSMKQKRPNVPILFVTVVRGETEITADESIDISQDIGPLIRSLDRIRQSSDGTNGH